MSDRIGDWVEVASGVQFYPLDPRPEDIHLSDIAHSLSLLCRFNGHCRAFYSVAEHSVRVARLVFSQPGCTGEHVQWALLHDAAEAYLSDVPRPLKRAPELQAYRDAEAQLMRCICQRFGLRPDEPLRVRLADNILLATEARDLMPQLHPWESLPRPLAETIEPWDSDRAASEFRHMASWLGIGQLQPGVPVMLAVAP